SRYHLPYLVSGSESTAVSRGMATAAPSPHLLPRQALDSAADLTSVGHTDKGQVLVAEDEPALLKGLARLLIARGYRVTTAINGQDAREKIRTQSFDLVLTDIAMPECDGLELLQQVRDTDSDVPVVLITGEPSVSTAVKALECGAFHYLTKPV